MLASFRCSSDAARIPLGTIGPDGEVIPHVDAASARAFAEPPAVDEAATLLFAAEPNAIVFAFTSSSYIAGAQANEALRHRLENRCRNFPVVIQSQALVTALRPLGARRISLIHPPRFSDDLDTLGAEYFREQVFDVLAHGQDRLRED